MTKIIHIFVQSILLSYLDIGKKFNKHRDTIKKIINEFKKIKDGQSDNTL